MLAEKRQRSRDISSFEQWAFLCLYGKSSVFESVKVCMCDMTCACLDYFIKQWDCLQTFFPLKIVYLTLQFTLLNKSIMQTKKLVRYLFTDNIIHILYSLLGLFIANIIHTVNVRFCWNNRAPATVR